LGTADVNLANSGAESHWWVPSLPHAAALEMWMRFAAHGAVARIYALQAIYRIHSSNMSRSYYDRGLPDLQRRKEAFDVFFKEYGDRLPEGQRLHERAIRRLAEKAFWGQHNSTRRWSTVAALFISASTQACAIVHLCGVGHHSADVVGRS
jgi:hypothetical protein